MKTIYHSWTLGACCHLRISPHVIFTIYIADANDLQEC